MLLHDQKRSPRRGALHGAFRIQGLSLHSSSLAEGREEREWGGREALGTGWVRDGGRVTSVTKRSWRRVRVEQMSGN